MALLPIAHPGFVHVTHLSLSLPQITAVDGQVDYDRFFAMKIQDKIDDKSYRQFRVLARNAKQFPTAKHFPESNMTLDEGRDITIWCSNDYMGMSKHPAVLQATM